MEKTMRIGGSNVAGICGISPWSTPLDEWLKITGQVTVPVNPAMEWGNRLEPVIRDKYRELTNKHVRYNICHDKLGIEFVHHYYPYITGSLDGISFGKDGDKRDNRVLEIKTARSRDAWDAGVPEYYELQCQHYMGLTGLQRTDVAVLFGASDFDIYELYRDDDMIKTITRLLVAFWENHVLTGIPPECTTPGDRNTRWPTSVQKAIEADESIKIAMENLRYIKTEIKRFEATQEDLESRLKDYLQDKDTLTIDGKPALTWKQSKASTVFDKARFESENYELFKRYQTTKPGSRRFIIKNLPGDIVDAAVKQCEETLKIKADVTPERIQSIIDKFAQFGVTKGMIELKIQRRIDAMTPALVVYLGKIFNSLKDGMSAPSDWFQQDPATTPATLADKLKAKLPQPIIEQQPDHIRDTTEKVTEPVQTTFRDEYIDLKKAGYSTFVFQNIDRLKSCSESLHAEAVAKWNKLYPDQICPFLNKKDDPTDTSIDSTHTDQTKQKAPIVCKKDEQHRGVFPEDCTACGKLDGCDQYSEYIFDLEHQNQYRSSDSSGF